MADLSPVDEARWALVRAAKEQGEDPNDANAAALDLAAIRLVIELEAERAR